MLALENKVSSDINMMLWLVKLISYQNKLNPFHSNIKITYEIEAANKSSRK